MDRIIDRMLATTAIVAAAAFLSLPAAHADEAGIKVGVLKCDVESGVSFVFGSTRDVLCRYSPTGGSEAETYVGQIEKYGVDIGYMESGVMVWAVLAPSEEMKAAALAGTYVGATADVALGAGVGAKVLVGGGNSIALQPLSISGAEGVNIAAGLAALKLNSAE